MYVPNCPLYTVHTFYDSSEYEYPPEIVFTYHQSSSLYLTMAEINKFFETLGSPLTLLYKIYTLPHHAYTLANYQNHVQL